MSQNSSNSPQQPNGEEPPQYGVRLPEDQRPAPPQQQSQPSNPYGGGQVPPPSPGQYGQQSAASSSGQSGPYSAGPYQNSPYQQGGFQQPGPYGPGQGTTPTPPKSIMVAFGLILAAGALTLVSGIILLMTPTPQLAAMLEELYAADPMLSEQLATTGISVTALADLAKTFGVVMMVVAVAIYALIAFFIRKGSNGARVTGTVLAVLSLAGLVGTDVLTMLTTLLGIGGIVAAWLRPSSQYIAAVKEAKRWRR
ncbi:hypothetical protein [Zhihengliuella flava]|uniref:DUF4064 domain-containing protein n=1 Tax=Zhihengliuella flava TaxID=1285193 RepID=A0A931GID2_9MICC|nr:hypothetical protein [Zhihengliuella flava]MBG6084141.1 hypothetical protein [Zhihengliuella flava]